MEIQNILVLVGSILAVLAFLGFLFWTEAQNRAPRTASSYPGVHQDAWEPVHQDAWDEHGMFQATAPHEDNPYQFTRMDNRETHQYSFVPSSFTESASE